MKTKGAKIADLLRLVQTHYEVNGLRSKDMIDLYIKNQLLPKLGERIANNMRKSHIEDYKERRLKEGASKVTISHELQVLSRAFTLGLEDEIIDRKPPIKLFPPPEPREGHYEPEEFAKWQAACRQLRYGDVVADITLFAYYSGWRLRECLRLQRDWVRLRDKIVVLPKQFSKNKRVKIYPLEGKILEMIEMRLARANSDGLLFHRNGKPVKDLRRMCQTVCKIIGVDSAHFFHNLRRSATTNINRAGIDKETGKKITGHTTDSVYHAYNQHTVDSLRIAVKKVEEYLEVSQEKDQVASATENNQEVQELTPKEVTEVPENTNETDLILYQTASANNGKRQGFLARVWRFITKIGGNEC